MGEGRSAKKLFLKIAAGLVLLLLLLAAPFYKSSKSVEKLSERYAQAPSKWVEVDGMRVHYRDEGSGPVLLLIHGTAAHLHTWRGWTEFFSKDYRVIRMDLPGFGLTGPHPEDDYTGLGYARFIDNFLDAIGVERCHVAGNSLGGEIAWNFALDQPDKVDRLILIDPAGFERSGEVTLAFRLARVPVLKQVMKSVTPKAMFRSSLEEVYYNDELVTDSLVEVYLDHLLRKGNRDAMVKRMNIDRSTARTDALKQISAPTLVMWGENDSWIPVEHGKMFVERIPNSSLLVLKETGHVPMEERPIISAEEAAKFLNESDSALLKIP